jgi:arylsulfatase A
MRTWSLRILATLTLLQVLLIGSLASSADRPPNFVVVLADDIGAQELGCYGNKVHQTPRLDRLAQEGMRFETCWSTPLCTPTRTLLMTGQYAFRTGYFQMFNAVWSPLPTSPEYAIGDKLTFADVLKTRGYATALTGKWQLAGEHSTLIRDAGFDTYRMWAYESNLPAGIKHTGRYEGVGNRTARYWHPSLVENGKYLETKPTDYGPDLTNQFAIDFIRQHRDQPFCLYYPMLLTHGPHEETPDPSRPGERRPQGLATNVEYLDFLMGQLVDAIDEAGLRENTLFIFVGDNGTAGDGKGTLTEMGVRVPLIIRGAEVATPGTTSRALVSVADLFPTLVELAGAKVPNGHLLDGRSLSSILRGEAKSHRDWVYSYLGQGRMIRDGRWLLEAPGGDALVRMYDCGDSRIGRGYEDVSQSDKDEVVAARQQLETILRDLPGPEKHVGLRQPGAAGAGKAKAGKKAKGKTKKAAPTEPASP